MSIATLPNPYSALTVRLRSFSEITALVGSAGGYQSGARDVDKAKPRVSPVLQDFWKLGPGGGHAILVRKAGGPPPDRDARIRTSRADLWYYGPGNDPGSQEMEAYRLWRTAHPALMPGHGESDAFIAANCRVYGITEEADPFPFVDTDTGLRIMVGPVLVHWSEVPA